MKTKFYLLLFLLAQTFCFGQQTSILFVNDNAVFPANTDTIEYTLSHSVTPLFDIFNARDSMRSPDYPEIMNYDLVIWYCSSDGVANYFWEGNDEDNFALKQYLDNGGKLWVMGTDFLYDRYSTPQAFVAGDFVYDYLGISEYHAQSYGDDGGLGVPQLDPEGPVTGMPEIHWTFSTAWWVDACIPASNGIGVYKMGPEGYILDAYYSGLLKTSNFKALSFCFDPAIIDTYANRLLLTNSILNYLLNIDAVPENAIESLASVYPNPVTNQATFTFPGQYRPGQFLQIWDLTGRIIKEEKQAQSFTSNYSTWTINLQDLLPGTYFCTLINGELKQPLKLIKVDE